jgi:hypothetical protein
LRGRGGGGKIHGKGKAFTYGEKTISEYEQNRRDNNPAGQGFRED